MLHTCVNCQRSFEVGHPVTGGSVYCPHCYHQNPVQAPQHPPAYLSMTMEDGSVRDFPLGPMNSIGRHPNNSVQIMDRMISKEHAHIEFKFGDFVLIDLGSRNGCYVNNRRIQEAVLNSGDELVLGTVRLTYMVGQQHGTGAHRQVTIISEDSNNTSKIAKISSESADRDFQPERDIKDIDLLRKDYEKLRIAHLLNRKIGLELNLQTLLDHVVEESFHLLPADRGVIMLMGPEGELIPQIVKQRGRIEGPGDEISISRTILNTVVQERAGVLSSDAKLDERFSHSESIIMQGIRSAMCVPLIAKSGGDVLGVMHMDTQNAIGVFTEKDLHILSAVASQTAVAIENARLAHKIEEETEIRAHLQRFLSPAVMARLTKDHLEIRMGGEMVTATIMFTDIRGFTSISEQYTPQELVEELNDYFDLLVDIIFTHEGTLDKFVGDAMMAVWGTPEAHPEDPIRAVQAAVEIQHQLKAFNEQRLKSGKSALYTGIGINTGPVVAGNMGSPKRLEFTVIGDHVNVASRLCSKAAPDEILISLPTFQYVKNVIRSHKLPPAELKGKAEPQQIYRVEGLVSTSEDGPTHA